MKFVQGVLMGTFLAGCGLAGLQACRSFLVWIRNPADYEPLLQFVALVFAAIFEIMCVALILKVSRGWRA